MISRVLLYVGCILMVLGPDMLKATEHHGRTMLKQIELNTLNTIPRVNLCKYGGELNVCEQKRMNMCVFWEVY